MLERVFDESKLLYGLGIFLGIASILYFGQQIILDLSPAVKASILLSAAAVFIGGAEYFRHGILRFSFYGFSTFSYLSFLTYLFARFQFSSEEVFLMLAASSAVFLGLGYLKSEKGYSLKRVQAKKFIGAVAVIIVVLIVFDVTGAQPEYSVELNEKVQVTEGEEYEIGVLEIRNDFPVSRNTEEKRFTGCIATRGDHRRNIYLRPDADGIIAGSSTETIPLKETGRRFHEEGNVSIEGEYSIVNEDCPSEPDDMTIYISEGESSGSTPSVVRD